MVWNDWFQHKNGDKSRQLIDGQDKVLCVRIRPKNAGDGSADRFEENGKRINSSRVEALEAQATLSRPRASAKIQGKLEAPDQYTEPAASSGEPAAKFEVVKPSVRRQSSRRSGPRDEQVNAAVAAASRHINEFSIASREPNNSRTGDQAALTSSSTTKSQKPYNSDLNTLLVTGSLPESYVVEKSTLFLVGRVFRHCVAEATNAANDPRGRDDGAYKTIRPFVVVYWSLAHCICVPVFSYGGQGIAKPSLKDAERRQHVVLYAKGTNEEILDGERPFRHLLRPGFAVSLVVDASLSNGSRIRFDQPYTFKYNLKVRNVGKIEGKEQLDRLVQYYTAATSTSNSSAITGST